jgi:pimeloyl-ACP methyl ester carboxylesterase
MNPIAIHNAIYTGAKQRNALVDIVIPENHNGKLILFMHGFMGFKDWGCWPLMQDYFVQKGFGFCKFNVSHNGTTIENPTSFTDLDAFSDNNYSKELVDLNNVIDWLLTQPDAENLNIILVGHSRGGGLALLGAKNPAVQKVVTLAAISSIERRFPEGKYLEEWKQLGVKYIRNNRTHQDMPARYSQYEDFLKHKTDLSIQAACEEINKPVLVIHGEQDKSVKLEEGLELSSWLQVPLTTIKNANHTFGASHPWKSENMPRELESVCSEILNFIH